MTKHFDDSYTLADICKSNELLEQIASTKKTISELPQWMQDLMYYPDGMNEMEHLRLDAERYRWLRNNSPADRSHAPTVTLRDGYGVKVIWQGYGVDERTQPRMFLDGENLDMAIDGMIARDADNGEETSAE